LRELPPSRFVPPLGFLDPSAVSSAVDFAGLFHPAATSRVHAVQGVLPIRSGPRLVAGPCPLAVRTCELTGDPVATRTPPTSRLPAAYRCVPRGRGLAFPPVAPLFGFLLLQA
jgi:hypothetical protein